MTDQQLLIYRTWLYEGTARLEPMPARPGWWWLFVGSTRVRALGPKNVTKLQSAVRREADA